MRRALILIVALALIGIAAWGYFGGLDRVTADRIESALVDRGLPPPMASCMAERMVDRLSLPQLRKLEQIGAPSGDDAAPLSTIEVLSRLRRIDDPEAVEVTATAAAVCAFGLAVPPG